MIKKKIVYITCKKRLAEIESRQFPRNKVSDKADELCINDSYSSTVQNGQNDYVPSTSRLFI